MNILRKLLDLLLQAVAVGAMVAIVALTAMHAATLQVILILLGTGLMTLAFSEQIGNGL